MWPRVSSGGYYIIAAACFFGCNGVAVKLLLRNGFSPLELVAIRSVASALVLLPLVLMSRRARAAASSTGGWLLVIGYGVTGFVIVPLMLYLAISRIPVGVAILVEYIAPALVAIWVWARGSHPVRFYVLCSLAFSLVGLSFVVDVWEGVDLDWAGVGAAVAAALALATSIVVGSVLSRCRNHLESLFWGFSLSGVVGIVLLLTPLASGDVATLPSWGLRTWLLIGFVILCGSLLPHLLLLRGLGRIESAKAGIVLTLEPVVAIIAGWVLLNELLSGWQLFGAALVLMGVFLAESSRRDAGRALSD